MRFFLQNSKEILVVGGGAGGVFSAIHAASQLPKGRVMIVEASQRLLSKVKISGGGRCNVTHHCFEPAALVKAYPRGSRELLGPFHRFGPKELMAWFEQKGVQLKTESDGRVFPVSDQSQTIIDALLNACLDAGVEIRKGLRVKGIQKDQAGSFVLSTDEGVLTATRIILATGSSPEGHALAKALGHSLVPAVPSLFTFKMNDPRLEGLEGTVFPNAKLSLCLDQQVYASEGPLLITHWGVSGPAVLKLSAFAARDLAQASYQADLKVSFDRAFSAESLADWFGQQRRESPKKQVCSLNPPSLSKKFWARLGKLYLPRDDLRFSDLPKGDEKNLISKLIDARFKVVGRGVFKEEFVTAGGVALEEVNFKTFESKICRGLFFTGEVLDIDGITGGFNFQNAWTSGFLAGQSAGSLGG